MKITVKEHNMNKLTDPKTTLAVISRYNFDFRKKFGQNFLIDEGVILRSLDAASVGKGDVVFEIGPGIGTLTQYLSDAAYHVVSIEIDKKLIPILEETLQGCDNVDVINEDVLKVDLLALARKYNAGRPDSSVRNDDSTQYDDSTRYDSSTRHDDPGDTQAAARAELHRDSLHPLKIVANLPYYITTPILMNLFRRHVPAQSITVMVQKEVADRMTAQPGGKDYGSLSVAVQYYSAPRIVETVPPSSFIPHPKVTSAVVTMDLYETPPVTARNEDLFDAIVRAAFEQRRKTLVNALSSNSSVPFGKEEITNALSRLGISASIRGEKLSISDFAALSDVLTLLSA